MSSPRVLVVVCHPRPESLTRSASQRVLAGLQRSGSDVRVLDLDAESFDPVLKRSEVQGHLGSPADRPDLAHHFEALRWCERLVLIYPTWNSGHPARLKGWFDRVWMHEVAFELPPGSNRIRGLLTNIARIDVVTSHGSGRRLNFIQGNAGRVTIRRGLRAMCNVRCRSHWHAIYDVDNADPARITTWLDRIERRFAKA